MIYSPFNILRYILKKKKNKAGLRERINHLGWEAEKLLSSLYFLNISIYFGSSSLLNQNLFVTSFNVKLTGAAHYTACTIVIFEVITCRAGVYYWRVAKPHWQFFKKTLDKIHCFYL